MIDATLTARVYAMVFPRPTPQARRGAVKVWSAEVERRLISGMRARLGAHRPAPGLAELHVRLDMDGVRAQPVRTLGSDAADDACLAAAQDPQAWPPPPPQIEEAEFVVQFEFTPEERL